MDSSANTERRYTDGTITVVWKPAQCIHSKICWKELLPVFDPRARPWVNMTGAGPDRIAAQVDRCPSGALSWFKNGTEDTAAAPAVTAETIVEVVPNGPLLVWGNVTVKHADGAEEQKHKATAFCRCGASATKPFCDGSHLKTGFRDA